MAPRDGSVGALSDGERHEWTAFEFDVMLSLICKGTHHNGIVEFATKFNEGLNGAGHHGGHRRDLDMEDIQETLVYILDRKKAAIAFIERQHMPRITRSQKRAFMRNIDFTGTIKEWKADGRKDVEALAHPARVRAMVERQQKEQFLRDFERRVELQDMQRDHQRPAGGGLGEPSGSRVTRDEGPGYRGDDEFWLVSRDSPPVSAAVNRYDGLNASANMPGSWAPTYPSNTAAQHQESTSVVPISARVDSQLSDGDGHVQQGDNIHETQRGMSTNTGLSDVSHTLPSTVKPLLDATFPGAHARDLLRPVPVHKQGQGLLPHASSATQRADSSWHGEDGEHRPPTSPDRRPASLGVNGGSSGDRQPCFETSGREVPVTGAGMVSEQIGGVGASMSRVFDRQSTFGMFPNNVGNSPVQQPILANQFADLQAQLYHQDGSSRNDSRLENLPPRGSRNRAPQ